MVKVNRDELTGLADAAGTDAGALVRGWLAAGSEAVIVTDGAAPTRVDTASARYTVESPRVPTRSAVGSGDAFAAGLVRSLLTDPAGGWPAHLRLAAACGASNAASVLARLAAEHPPSALIDRVVVRTEAGR